MGKLVLPGATIGIIGGGQLGKMIAIAAETLGYNTVIWSEEEECPACNVATSSVVGKYRDEEAFNNFIKQVDIATVETEHIPYTLLEAVAQKIPLYPSANIIKIAQNRREEKLWLDKNHYPTAPFELINSIEALRTFQQRYGDIVIKTITGGYDGKGQLRITTSNLTKEIIEVIDEWINRDGELIAEAWLPIEKEFSIIAARNANSTFATFPLSENEHRDHILHRTIVPAQIDNRIEQMAIELTEKLMNQLDYIGLLCIEFFYDKEGRVYINELAPRPHNSGHYTIDAAITSQFEQAVRAICGLPLGSTKILAPSVMVNLLGDLWQRGFKINEIINEPEAKLHLYGKKEARMKRKMGHYTITDNSLEQAIKKAEYIYLSLEK